MHWDKLFINNKLNFQINFNIIDIVLYVIIFFNTFLYF